MKVEFASTCYAFALYEFARTLRELADGKSETAVFPGSSLDIHVRRQPKTEWAITSRDFAPPPEPVFVCELAYETPRWVFGTTSFRLQLGGLDEPLEAARIIENALKWLEMDLDPLPHETEA